MRYINPLLTTAFIFILRVRAVDHWTHIMSVPPPARCSDGSRWVYALALTSLLPSRLSANMTSSTKPEVRNPLHCRQRRTKPHNIFPNVRFVYPVKHTFFTTGYTQGDSDVISPYDIYASCFPPFCGASSAKCLLFWRHFLSNIALIRAFS